MGTRSPNPEIAGTLSEPGLLAWNNLLDLLDVAAARNNLAVYSQSAIDALFAQLQQFALNRINHIGNDPAGNVVFVADEITLEQWRDSVESRFASGGASDPIVTSDPSIAGTAAIGTSLVLTRGSVTNGSGAAHQDVLTWWFLSNAVGATPQVLFTETIDSAVTPSTFPKQVAQLNGTIYATQQAKDTVSQRLSNTKASNTIGPITGAAPTNSVAPTISGSAAAGSALTVNVQTWSGAATFIVQLYADGVPYGSPSAKSASTTVSMGNSDNSIVGKALTARITAYSSLDVPSATAVLTSNSITVTGAAPAVANTAPPAWPATINFGTKAVGTIGTWTGSIHAVRSYEYYIGVPDSTPDFGPQSLFEHTPRSPAVAGNTLYVIERVYDAATGTIEVGSAVSAGKVISAAIATFAAALTTEGAAGYPWTQSSAISQANIATLSGGTQPWKLDPTTPFSPALPAGISVSISGANVIATGTPSAVSSSTAYTINFKDSAGSPASASITFTASVAAASGVVPLPIVTPSSHLALNGTVAVSGAGYKYRITDPNYPGDVESRSEHYAFNDADANDLQPGNDYWSAYSFAEDSVEYTRPSTGDDEMVVKQIHTRGQGATQPDKVMWLHRQTSSLRFSRSYNTKAYSTWANQGGANPDVEATVHEYSEPIPPPGTTYYFIERYRPGYTTAHAPAWEVWISRDNRATYQKIVNRTAATDFNTYNVAGSGFGGSYERIGPYKYNGSKWNSAAIAMKFSKFAFKKGTNLYAEAVAYLATL